MAEHIAADEAFERTDEPAEEAIERFREAEEPYKVELIEDLVADEGAETVSLYRNGPSSTSAAARTGPRPAGSRRSS